MSNPAHRRDTQPPQSGMQPERGGARPSPETDIVCERCGAVNLVRVKGCWYCERCHYKFDCYGW